MPFFQIMWSKFKDSKNRFFMTSHFGTLLKTLELKEEIIGEILESH